MLFLNKKRNCLFDSMVPETYVFGQAYADKHGSRNRKEKKQHLQSQKYKHKAGTEGSIRLYLFKAQP